MTEAEPEAEPVELPPWSVAVVVLNGDPGDGSTEQLLDAAMGGFAEAEAVVRVDRAGVPGNLGFGIRRHRLAPTSVLVWDVVLVVASPVCLREITMLEWLPHKMIFVVCPRVRD